MTTHDPITIEGVINLVMNKKKRTVDLKKLGDLMFNKDNKDKAVWSNSFGFTKTSTKTFNINGFNQS